VARRDPEEKECNLIKTSPEEYHLLGYDAV
jgi:hypothetical protein